MFAPNLPTQSVARLVGSRLIGMDPHPVRCCGQEFVKSRGGGGEARQRTLVVEHGVRFDVGCCTTFIESCYWQIANAESARKLLAVQHTLMFLVSRFGFEQIDLAITSQLANQPVASESESERAGDQCQSAVVTRPVNLSRSLLSRVSRHLIETPSSKYFVSVIAVFRLVDNLLSSRSLT